MLDRGDPVTFVDSRNPIAWASSKVKIPGARRIPLDEVPQHLDVLPRDQQVVVYCTCPGDASSARVARYLAKHGFTASYLLGGLQAWMADDGPVEAR
jgi:rhodanese-related sulfurtransferase